MENNVVYLLVGQRGSGKSQYCERLSKAQPEFSVISRDEILIRLFGSTDTDPHGGEQHMARCTMGRLLRRKLSTKRGLALILDAWTGGSRERQMLIENLRGYGADRIVALYFITSLETVNAWFWKKPGIAKFKEMAARRGQGLSFFSEDAPAHDYELFHRHARDIDEDGFDEVIRIDPEKELITLA